MKPPPVAYWKRADGYVAAAVVLVVGATVWQAAFNLEYIWNWPRVLEYVASRGEDGWQPGLIATGFANMLRLLVIAGVGAAALGLAIGIAGASRNAGLRFLAACYVELVRNQPLLVFLFVFYYFVSDQIVPRGDLGLADSWWGSLLVGDPDRASDFIAGALCLMFYEAAFVAEIVRGGIQAVEPSLIEGGRALSLNRLQVMRLITVPLALRRTVPPLVSQLVLLIKNSSVISVISVQELTFAAIETANSIASIFEPLLIAALLYFMICWPLTVLAGRLELAAKQASAAGRNMN